MYKKIALLMFLSVNFIEGMGFSGFQGISGVDRTISEPRDDSDTPITYEDFVSKVENGWIDTTPFEDWKRKEREQSVGTVLIETGCVMGGIVLFLGGSVFYPPTALLWPTVIILMAYKEKEKEKQFLNVCSAQMQQCENAVSMGAFSRANLQQFFIEQLGNDERKKRNILINKRTGKTFLHTAAENGHADMVQQLLPIVPVKVKDNQDEDAWDKAATNGHYTVLNVLNHVFFPHNGKDEQGETPLHKAVGKAYFPVIHTFLQNGISMFVKNDQGENPWQKAKRENKQAVLQFINQRRLQQFAAEDDTSCFMCMQSDVANNDPFDVCDYECLTPICVPCKGQLKQANQGCPHCRNPLD